MTATVRLTAAAESDLEEIYVFTALRWGIVKAESYTADLVDLSDDSETRRGLGEPDRICVRKSARSCANRT